MPGLILFLLLLSPVASSAEDRYRVAFENDLSAVTVEACFNGAPPRNLYRHGKAWQHTDWIRAEGREFRPWSRNERVNLPELPQDACIEWKVNLSSALAQDDYRLALRLDDAILTSGNLWFWRDGDRRPIRILVELPDMMSISAPWKDQHPEPGARVFRPERTPASWSSRIAVGRFPVQRIAVAGTELRLTAIGDLDPARRTAFAGWIRETAESVASIYGRFPQAQPQILVVAIGRQGEAVPWAHVIRGGGIAAEIFVDQHRPLSEFRADWTATHELSHMLLPYVSSRDRWFSEGLASYYQNVLRARDGRLSEHDAWQKLQAGFERGRRATRGGSLASATRSGRAATMRIYWSGAAMMLKADTRLRALTDGRQSLDSALSKLPGCCFSEGRIWRAQNLFAELDRVTGYTVFSDLYNEHVSDDDFPDTGHTFERLGLAFDAGSVTLDPDAPWGRIRFYIMNETGNSGP
jgi:hypothetical protein